MTCPEGWYIFFEGESSFSFCPSEINKSTNELRLQNNKTAIIKDIKSALTSIEDWSRVELENIFENLMEQHDVAIGQVMKPIRVALSGIPFGPGIFDLILLLGKDICQIRLRHTLSEVE